MDKSKYDKFKALDPFFNIVMKGLDRLVDGDHFWTPLPTRRCLSFATVFRAGPNALKAELRT